MMKTVVRVVAMLAVAGASHASAQGTTVFNNLPDVLPGNVLSLGFQCCGTSEFGDEIILEAGTPRRAGVATVLMSSWSLRAYYPLLPNDGYAMPITLNIYADAESARAHAPVKSLTQTFTIPWRPAADPSCAGGAWKSSADGVCYNGVAFNIAFDLRALNYDLPSHFIYGVEYDTTLWGYHPRGVPGPYDSLNVGFTTVASPTVGDDADADVVFWNTVYPAWYSDGGAAGSGTFRADTNWTGFAIGAKFTTFAVPATGAECKNGGWQSLVRADFTRFQNQGQCVSYVNGR